MAEWRPEITVLTCMYCGNIPVETAGLQRIAYSAAVKVLSVPCTGTVGVLHLLTALEQGADGVLLVACPEENCHHLSGSRRAEKRLARARALLQEADLAPDRLRFLRLGIGHGQAFADAVNEMTARIQELGPARKEGV